MIMIWYDMLRRHHRLALHVVVCTDKREVSMDISKRVQYAQRMIGQFTKAFDLYSEIHWLCSALIAIKAYSLAIHLVVKQACHQQPGSCSTRVVSTPRSSPGRSFKNDYQRHLTTQEKSYMKLQNTLDMLYSSILSNLPFLLVLLCFISLIRREEIQRGVIHWV